MMNYLDFFESRFSPREEQVKMLEYLSKDHDSVSNTVVDAPTGTGKSAAIIAIGLAYVSEGKRVAVVVATNQLMDQYTRDYPDIHKLKGQSHYYCVKLQDKSCAEAKILADAGKVKCDCSDQVCPYKNAKALAAAELMTIFNVNSLFYNHDIIKQFDLIMFDEYQKVPGFMRGCFEISIPKYDLEYPVGISRNTDMLIEFLKKYRMKMDRMLPVLYDINPKKASEVREKMLNIGNIIQSLENYPEYYAIEETEEEELLIRPCKLAPKSLTKILSKAKRIMLFSATCYQHDYEELGVDKPKIIKVNSPIPYDQRMVYLTKSYNNDYSSRGPKLYDLMADTIRKIVKHHEGEKGVVLCTYNEGRMLKERLFGKQYLFHDNKNKNKVFEEFKLRKDACVAILSGSFEGIDLKDDMARFNIITIVPYQNMGDLTVKMRMNMDPQWYASNALQMVEQGCGRTCRNPGDYSAMYVLDNKIINLINRHGANNLNKYFRDSLKVVDSLDEAFSIEKPLREKWRSTYVSK